METLTTGAGLGALGFWIFVASIIVAGVWSKIRKRDAQHETLRRIIESGQQVDEALVDKLLSNTAQKKDAAKEMRTGGLVLFGIAPAMLVFGWIMGIYLAPPLLPIMGAVAAMLGMLGIALVLVARYLENDAAPDRVR